MVFFAPSYTLPTLYVLRWSSFYEVIETGCLLLVFLPLIIKIEKKNWLGGDSNFCHWFTDLSLVSITSKLCDLGKATWRLCVSLSPSRGGWEN